MFNEMYQKTAQYISDTTDIMNVLQTENLALRNDRQKLMNKVAALEGPLKQKQVMPVDSSRISSAVNDSVRAGLIKEADAKLLANAMSNSDEALVTFVQKLAQQTLFARQSKLGDSVDPVNSQGNSGERESDRYYRQKFNH